MRQKRGSTAAFVAACVLVLQSVFSAWPAGAMPIQPMLDAFGNPLCVNSMDQSDGPSDHSKLPNCCTFGCSTVSPLLPVPDFDGSAIARPLVISHILFTIGKGVALSSPDHHPGNPRAPPLTA